MKKLGKLKLNQLDKVELKTRQMDALRGGDFCGCACVCYAVYPPAENTYTAVYADGEGIKIQYA